MQTLGYSVLGAQSQVVFPVQTEILRYGAICIVYKSKRFRIRESWESGVA